MVWLHCFVHSWNINDNGIMEIESLLLCRFIIIRVCLYICPPYIQVGAAVLEPKPESAAALQA